MGQSRVNKRYNSGGAMKNRLENEVAAVADAKKADGAN